MKRRVLPGPIQEAHEKVQPCPRAAQVLGKTARTWLSALLLDPALSADPTHADLVCDGATP